MDVPRQRQRPKVSRVLRFRPPVGERRSPPSVYVSRIKKLVGFLRTVRKNLDRKAIGGGIWIAGKVERRGILVRVTLDGDEWAVLDDMARRLGAPSTARFIENALAALDVVLAEVAEKSAMTPEEIAEMNAEEDASADLTLTAQEIAELDARLHGGS